jgi:ParB-like chromosome segregation protein Spo0J
MNKIIGKDLTIDIGKVKPNTWNPKESIEESMENKKKYEEIKREVEKKGLFEAITVREVKDGYEILDGYHRWLACKELGFNEIRINTLGKIDDKLARAITVVKEQKKVPISELGISELVGWFREQDTSRGDIMELLGYTEEQYEEYEKMFDFDWEGFDDERPDTNEEKEEEEVICPKCGHKFNV